MNFEHLQLSKLYESKSSRDPAVLYVTMNRENNPFFLTLCYLGYLDWIYRDKADIVATPIDNLPLKCIVSPENLKREVEQYPSLTSDYARHSMVSI